LWQLAALWKACFNCILEAAPLHLQKACVAILQVAVSLQNMLVWNGPVSYGLCTNKWCHHMLFSKARLSCPSTQAEVLEPMATTLQEVINNVHNSTSKSGTLLLMPNVGGFVSRHFCHIPSEAGTELLTLSGSHAM